MLRMRVLVPVLWCSLQCSLPLSARVGTRVGVEVSPADFDPEVQVQSTVVLDSAFSAAPVEWEPHGGLWSVCNRYPCDTTWSYFGGQSLGLCSLGSKRRYTGDVVVEAYIGFMHAVCWAPEAWDCEPSDLNVSLVEQTGDLGHGTSFIYSGVNGSSTQIRRGGNVLVSTSDPAALVPQFLDRNQIRQPDASGQELGLVERRWWRLEAQRRGGRLALRVDDRTLVECANPYGDGPVHVVFWTMNSGMMLARVRISCDGIEQTVRQPLRVHEAPPQ